MIDIKKSEALATHLSEVAQQCAECNMQETAQDIVSARWAILELCTEIRTLKSRLELDPRTGIDGIEARDVTIRGLEESRDDWKRRWQDAVDHASEAITERNHWQANHDNQVARARFLIERGDIPVERVRAYGLMGALLELEEAIRHDREMFDGTSDEFNPTGALVTQALAAIDAARKEST